MAAIDPKDYLWKNICSLMGNDAPTVDVVQERLDVGRGTVQRIKKGETSVGTDILVQIAGKFGLEAWQLLVPGLKLPDEAPVPEHALSAAAMRLAVHFDDMLTTQQAKQVGYQAVMEAISASRRSTQPPAIEEPVAVRRREKQRE